jgi:hypothetical protein
LAFKNGKNDSKTNSILTFVTLLVLIAYPVFVFFFLKRMANWRMGQKFGLYNLKDSYFFFCKSRKHRRLYENDKILKVETPKSDEEKKQENFKCVLISDK